MSGSASLRRRIPGHTALGVLCGAVLATPLLAQEPAAPGATDTARVFGLETLVVTAERSRAPVDEATGAAAVLTRAELERSGARTLADALERMPGFAMLDFGGLGQDPQPTIRGFYGGGEADYVVVLLDGRPVNTLSTGRIDWDLVPVSAVERVEVLRGGASSLYGDAAIGGVVNVVTRHAATHGLRGQVVGGELGTLEGSLSVAARAADRPVSAFASARASDGFREHAERRTGTAGGSISLLAERGRALDLTAVAHWRRFDVPGPLAGPALEAARTASSDFFRFDRSDERVGRAALDGRAAVAGGELRGYIGGELRRVDATRTLPLSPDFADTQDHELSASRVHASAVYEADAPALPWPGRVVVGTDLSYGRFASDYWARVTGDASAYSGATHARGEHVAGGTGSRGAAAAFARWELRPTDALRVVLGGRLDGLRDRFTTAAGPTLEADHAAFSPKLGFNLEWIDARRQSGHVYANLARSFKAPTPSQLFDPRRIPVPIPPYAVTTSNALLGPQHGVGIEGGLYHSVDLLPGRVGADLSLAVYRMDMEDELDFSLEKYTYVNLARSRHDGLEAGLVVRGPAGTRAFANYTLQDVTARNGEFAGNHLKAVPRHFLSAGASALLPAGVGAGVTVSSAHGMWLDDANTLELPGYTRVDARISWELRGVSVSLDVRNVLDAEYSSTGYVDPAGTGLVYYYPAAGRVLRIGLGVR